MELWYNHKGEKKWSQPTSNILSVWGQDFFCIFIFYFASGVQLKSMDEIFLLSGDEPLTPNIDGVVAL